MFGICGKMGKIKKEKEGKMKRVYEEKGLQHSNSKVANVPSSQCQILNSKYKCFRVLKLLQKKYK